MKINREAKIAVKTNGSTETFTNAATYKIFTMPNCDKCAAVKEHLATTSLRGEEFDLSSDEGLATFKSYYKNLKGQLKRHSDGSLPIPTTIFFDNQNKMLGVAQKLDEVKKFT